VSTIRHIARQTIASDIELILVTDPTLFEGSLPEEIAALHSCRVLASNGARTAATVNAIGARAASASLVVLCEDHCFPEPAWAEALIAVFEERDVVAAGPVFRNANPGTAISRADFIMGYGPWMAPMKAGDAAFLPGHNSCYRTETLTSQGSDLESCLDAEAVFHEQLRTRGLRLRIVPEATVRHLNFAKLRPWLAVSVGAGRLFGSRRAGAWPVGRRLQYIVGGPLIPVVRMVRSLALCRNRSVRLDPTTAAMLFVGLCADACGQLVGYMTRRGNAEFYCADFNRGRFLAPEDQALLAMSPDAPLAASAPRPAGEGPA
jgi:GT2 family glycosyltransferase